MKDRSNTPIARKKHDGKKRRSSFAAPVAAMPWGRMGCFAASTVVCVMATAGIARADSTFRITVRSSADGKPIPGATVSLDETSGRELRQTIPADAEGLAVSPTLTSGTYRITIRAVGFQDAAPLEVTLGDAPVPVDLQLTPLGARDIIIDRDKELVRRGDTTVSTIRDQNFVRRFPITEGNRQSMPRLLTAFPGFAYDALNQVHPRGEQNGKSIYLNGILLPPTLQGNISQFLSPEAIGSFRVITGNFSPEFGGQSGAVLDLKTRPPYDPSKPAGTRRPLLEFGFSGGQFATWDNFVNIGNTVRAAGLPKGRGGFERTLDYTISLGQHYSDNGVEPASENGQTANNNYSSEVFFADVGLNISPTTRISAIANYSSGRNQVANRLAPANGFLGRDPGFPTDQEDEGKSTRQKDNSNAAFIQLSQQLKNAGAFNVSAGFGLSDISIYERGAEIGNSDGSATTNSWEYVSSIGQITEQSQFQADLTIPSGFTTTGARAHVLKVGFVYQDQTAGEAYYYKARSAEALTALRQISPELADRVEFGGDLPVLFINRTGNYGAFYAQDTFRLSALPLVINYGFRMESYKGENDFIQSNISKSEFCPRINLAYTFAPAGGPSFLRFLNFLGKTPTIFRVGYNRLFTQPQGLGQGLIRGNNGITPQLTNQFDISLEKQLGTKNVVKINAYSKDIDSTLDASQLVAGTQAGPFTTFNLGDSTVKGTEFVYDFNPQGDPGLGAFLVFANSTSKPKNNATNNLGQPVGSYLDHDQRNTLTAGLSFALPNGLVAGSTLYYGSGVYASSLAGEDSRESITEFNLRIGTGPRYAKNRLGFELGVQNLFDSKSRINDASPFAGYRYQQGRRVRLGVTGKF
ncbi:MAG: TonB-dependent receptor [Armatimonadota bacterium]